jgi:hypothetical protein
MRTRAVHASEVPVDERVARLGVVGRALGQAEVPGDGDDLAGGQVHVELDEQAVPGRRLLGVVADARGRRAMSCCSIRRRAP